MPRHYGLFALIPFAGVNAQYSLTVEASLLRRRLHPVRFTGSTYFNDATDKMSAVFGNDQTHLIISTPDGIFNSAFNSGWNAAGISSAFLGFFPDLADDSYATIGLEGAAAESGITGAADPLLVEVKR